MTTKLPYVNQPGSIVKVLEKVRNAQTPERFTGDFLETKLSCRGGNYRQFIPFAKKIGFLGSDGRPTEIYKQFRNSGTSSAAIGHALRTGYRELFQRNEYANNLAKDQFKGLVVEVTGLESNSRVVQLICQTFEALKKLANFEVPLPKVEQAHASPDTEPPPPPAGVGSLDHDIGMNLSYTINLVLPKSDDPAVFSAIFRALRENLLRK